MKLKELYSATLSLDNEMVLLIKFKDEVEVDIEEAKNIVDASLKMVSGEPFYLLADARDIHSSMDHDSRKYIAEHKEFNRLNIAQSILVNNMHIRLIANFYFKFYGHINPVKIFTDFKQGKKWLLSNG